MSKTKASSPKPTPDQEVNVVAEEPKQKKAKVSVARYDSEHGILGFWFEGVPCQINVAKGLDIGKEVTVKYVGDIEDHIEFTL